MYLKSKAITKEALKKIDSLIEEMTLKEKIGQLHQVAPSAVGAFDIPKEQIEKMLQTGQITKEEYELSKNEKIFDRNENDVRNGLIGSFLGLADTRKINRLQRIAVEESRLHIPLIFGGDIIHGHSTVFPTPIAESCSFDDELFEQTAAAAAKEASAAGFNWTFAPMLDIARDARWGRISECMGQDTYLSCNYATRKVIGFQGNDLSEDGRLAACAKHYIAYGACEGGRDYNTVDMSLQKLYETYLPPFTAAVDAGVATVMPAFNDFNGVPCTANSFLLKKLLREKLGFDGTVVSDAGAVKQCVTHGYSPDNSAAAKDALSAGVDIDMASYVYHDFLEMLVEKGEVDEALIDKAVRNVLLLKFACGLFDNPYCDETKKQSALCTKENIALSLRAAQSSTVLLKNDGILPLNKDKYKNIALIGALADIKSENYGSWAFYGRDDKTITLAQALTDECDNVTYTRCYSVFDEINEAEFEGATRKADVVIAVLGEYAYMSGEAHSYADISLSKAQREVVKRLKALGKPFICVLYNGRPLCVSDVDESANAVIEAWQSGNMMGKALCDIIFGRFNPCARLTSNFPYKSGECPSYYNRPSTGRPAADDNAPWSSKYDDGRVKPVYPFGHGLSYTSFSYSEIEIIKSDKYARICVDIKNDGDFDGYEIAQLYIHDLFASRVRPIKELKGYKKVFIKKGETKRAEFILPYSALGFYDSECNFVVEKGEFEIFVGGSSDCDNKKIIKIE